MSSIDIMIAKYEHARSELEATVRSTFPVGTRVLCGRNPSIAKVAGYSENSPCWIQLLFENGNIWDKPVRDVRHVESIKAAALDFEKLDRVHWSGKTVQIIELGGGYAIKFDPFRVAVRWTAIGPMGRIKDVEAKEDAIRLIRETNGQHAEDGEK